MSDKPTYNGPEYPTEAHGSIPAFNSYEEEANFWDTHSTADFTNETEAVKVHALSLHFLAKPLQAANNSNNVSG
jgi:hypothetical protein